MSGMTLNKYYLSAIETERVCRSVMGRSSACRHAWYSRIFIAAPTPPPGVGLQGYLYVSRRLIRNNDVIIAPVSLETTVPVIIRWGKNITKF